ncbi:MAG: terminase small subunit [Janthinobacterium lividum]
MTEDLEEEIPEPSRFTVRQQRFIEEFCTGKNCTQAAISAGYSPESAYNQGSRLMKNDEIRAAVDERLNAYSISAMMATKLNAEIAITRLNDFFTIIEVQGYEQEQHCLSVLVERKRDEVAFITDFAHKGGIQLATLAGPTEMGKRLATAQHQLLELELEVMAYGPEAVKLVPGKPVIIERAELDHVKLAKAKEGGRLKSYSVGKEGIKVEMYAADAAIDRAARMHGLYEKDNRQLLGTEVEIIMIGGHGDE